MPGTPWTEDEKRLLRDQLLSKGTALKDVSVHRRTLPAIHSQAVRMGLIELRAPRLTWSSKEKQKLRALKRAGYGARDIYILQLLGDSRRSYWAIRKQWGRMKLADRTLSRRMKKKKIWSPHEKHRFRRFLLQNSFAMTPEQIGKIWGVARSTVARWQSILGVKQPRDKVMQMDFSQAKQKRARQRIRRKNRQRWAIRRAQHETELKALAVELRKKGKPPQERICNDCGRSWPIRRKFFHYSEKLNDFGTSRYYANRCRLCQNARRRQQNRRRGGAATVTSPAG